MNTFIVSKMLLLLGLATSTCSGAPITLRSQKPSLPAPVQDFVVQARKPQTFVVDVTRVSPDGTPLETAHLVLAPPNQVYLTTQVDGQIVSTLASNGRTLSWWDGQQVLRRPAPASLAQLDSRPVSGANVSIPLSFTANVALRMFADPTQVAKLTNLKDDGPEKLNAQGVRKVEAFDGDCQRVLWFSQASGMPVKLTSQEDNVVYTFIFDYPKVPLIQGASSTAAVGMKLRIPQTTGGQSVPRVAAREASLKALFVTQPPAGLTAYAPSKPALLTEPLKVGAPAPELGLTTLEGKTISLASLKGQIVLLNFASVWAFPSQKALPQIEKLRQDYSAEGLHVFSVFPLDQYQTLSQVQDFARKHPEIVAAMLTDPNAFVASQYHVSALPAVYLLDASGHIAASWVGYSPHDGAVIQAELIKLGKK